MNILRIHLLSTAQQRIFARACALVRISCKKTILAFLITLAVVVMPSRMGKAAGGLPAVLTGPAVLDDWGNRFISFGQSVREHAFRTQVRTAIAQLAMFDAVNAALDGRYRPFASRPPSAAGASAEAAAIRAAYIIALNEFPTIKPDIQPVRLFRRTGEQQ